jgi:glucan phosphoethanolaminetransferase (alkaline phosphatase superfamily)
MKARTYLLVELLMWSAVPLAFLGIYVVRFHQAPVVIQQHLYPVALLAALALLSKALLYRALAWRAPVQAAYSLFFVSLLALALAYYYLVLVGLRSWGKVITEELIVAYARQASGLCEAMGLSFPAVLAAIVLAWGVMVALHYGFARRFEPAPPARTGALVKLLMLSLALLLLYRLHDYLIQEHLRSSEPFNLTLHSGKVSPGKVDRSVIYNAEFDQQEAAARKAYRPAADARRRNVIMIVADGLRADHMQPYGYARATTPWLQQQVGLGQLERFDNVHSMCSESNCSMASLLSSREVAQLPSEPFTLSQVLKLHGYATVMILGGDQTNYYNKRALFGKVDDYFDGSMAKGYYMNDDSFVAVQTAKLPVWNGKPTMLQFHLMSAHLLGKRLDAYRSWEPSGSYARIPESDPQPRFTNFYDNGVLQYDDFVRQILTTLRQKKYLDDALVVVTSDHGESLGERRLMAHANGVHEPVLHIPLLVAGLRAAPDAPAGKPFISQTDIAPTLLSELGMPIPATWRGTPIRTLQAGARNTALAHFQMYEYAGLFDGRQAGKQWKYWVNRHTKEEFVYDLAGDPQELKNVPWLAPEALLIEWRKSTLPDRR